jgi:dienelactone hydrolase
LTPELPVAVHKVEYETITPWGARTVASGVVAVPQKDGVSWPLVSYQHGTLAKKSEAPSAAALGEQLLGVAFATAGYVAALPDYLGLGDSPGVQPYHHARSHGTSGVDMLRAARTFCATHGIALNSKLFLCGYSHGGYAAMAVLREMEQYHAAEFQVTAAATMAGAYDLAGVTTDDFLSERAVPNPYYSALLLAAYQDVPSRANPGGLCASQHHAPMLTDSTLA